GGGSSDAAAVLKNTPPLWNKEIDPRRLQALALELGSDVPFFLTDSSAYAGGRGEKLSYFPLPLPYWIVVVYPNIHVATPWAYKALSEKRNGIFPVRDSITSLFPHPSIDALLSIGNDFEEVVFDRYPEIARVKTSLLHFGAARALMSGSGSSVFGLFEHKTDAGAASDEFSKKYFTHITEPN
ncbi:MAG: 4-(cytidine 5'-diphospho)-2-C-methyl-D-erythritol kinase, partial [Bacteroidota bacterium]